MPDRRLRGRAATVVALCVRRGRTAEGRGGDDGLDGQPAAQCSGAARPSARPASRRGRPTPRRQAALPRSAAVFAPGRSDRRIERSVALELGAPADEMERLAEQVTAVTNRYGGFVLSSSLSTGEDGAGGDFDLRIPAARLRPALRELSGLATVRSQSQSGRDVTRQHVTGTRPAAAARAERAGLLRRLEEADTDAEAEAIRAAARPRGRRDPRPARAQLRDLRLAHELRHGHGLAGRRRTATRAAAARRRRHRRCRATCSSGCAGVLIRVLALALPLGLLALAAWLAGAAIRRRRRESALV